MEDNNIPDWYIESCHKIQYMFPKAHACAYVMSAIRIAWFKVYQPLNYYATFFSIRVVDFDIDTMIKGYDAIKLKIEDLENKFKELTKDKSTIRQVITHQNFDYSHVFIAKDKIISNEKMQICSPVYEIQSLFEHSYFGSIDLSGCLTEYFDKFTLEDYEIEWLLALLYVPIIKFYLGNDFKNLTNIMQSVFMVKSVEELESEIKK